MKTTIAQHAIRDIAKAAFYQTHPHLSALLTVAYPNGCSLAEAIEWAKCLPWKVTHWKRQNNFLLMYLCCDMQPGVHPTIDGKRIFLPQGSRAWSGCNFLPEFETAEAAETWARENGLNLVSE